MKAAIANFYRVAACIALLMATTCGEEVNSQSPDDGPGLLRLGYAANLTHAPAVIGVSKRFFADALGAGSTVETHLFNAGPDAVTALLSGSIDAAFMGPNPTANAYAQSHGQAIRVVAGSTSGGALLVVRPEIHSISDLKGKKIADPQLGGTQDIALRWFLKTSGFPTDSAGGGDVSIVPESNARTLLAYRQRQVDGAWLPEPWASSLVLEDGATVLVDERTLWPKGTFITTNLAVTTSYLKAHPLQVKALLEGLFQVIAYLNRSPQGAQMAANTAISEITGIRLRPDVVTAAWSHMTFTLDPLASTLRASSDHAHILGMLPSVDLRGLYDLTLLNQVLAEHKQQPVVGL